MRTFSIKYRIPVQPTKTQQKDVDAINTVQAKRIIKREYPDAEIISCEDISGPSELKELLRF